MVFLGFEPKVTGCNAYTNTQGDRIVILTSLANCVTSLNKN